MAYLARWIDEDGYDVVVSYLETRLSHYIQPQNNPSEGVPAEVKTYFPHPSSFSNKWPVLAVAELPPEGGIPSISDTRIKLRALRFGVRIYRPSIIVPEKVAQGKPEYQDAREAAKRVTRAVWSNWLSRFGEDTELEAWAMPTIGAIEIGDESRVGNPFYLDDRGSRLWIHQTEVSLEL